MRKIKLLLSVPLLVASVNCFATTTVSCPTITDCKVDSSEWTIMGCEGNYSGAPVSMSTPSTEYSNKSKNSSGQYYPTNNPTCSYSTPAIQVLFMPQNDNSVNTGSGSWQYRTNYWLCSGADCSYNYNGEE